MTDLRTEVTPGMFSLAEEKVTWRSTIVMGVLAVVVLVVFGLLGRDELVSYKISDDAAAFVFPAFVIQSSTVNILSGVLLMVLTGIAAWVVMQGRRVSLLILVAFGAIAIFGFLGWLAAGDTVPLAFLLVNALVLATPIIFGGISGVMSERVGVVNISIEAQLLSGAFVGAVVGSLTGNLYIALVAAMITGMLLGMILAVFAVKYLADQIIVGVVLNVLVIGITNFLFSQWLSEDSDRSNFPGTLEVFAIPFLSDIPVIGPVIFENRVTVFAAFIAVPVLWWVLFRSRLGLRARSVGEYPLAADTVGINVGRTRFWWVSLGGMLAGFGGAALTIGNTGSFGKEMTAGQGFIALAVVILGRWHPLYMSAAALLFGFSIILRVWANQVSPGIPTDFILMVPYLVTLIAVVGFVGKVRPPAADGKPYVKE